MGFWCSVIFDSTATLPPTLSSFTQSLAPIASNMNPKAARKPNPVPSHPKTKTKTTAPLSKDRPRVPMPAG